MLSIIRYTLIVLMATWVFPVVTYASDQLAIIVNSADPDSQVIADYYQKKRGIPDKNIILVEFPYESVSIDKNVFQKIRKKVEEQTPEHIQFYALAWSKPFKVDCMSITSAFTFGFDEKYCALGCKPTAASPYFYSDSRAPFDDFKIRPSMMLAGSSVKEVFSMIDRGVRSDHSFPRGTAYLVSTSDKARNTRADSYSAVISSLSNRLILQQVNADVLKNKKDILFYFTGLASVKDITTNQFIDGAIADHLTSVGGYLFGGTQMSILRWLDAGATASYGTVVEPCAFPQKFPHPGIVIDRYRRGEKLIEAYWKSVEWPGQGVFVGEPLAAPFKKRALQ